MIFKTLSHQCRKICWKSRCAAAVNQVVQQLKPRCTPTHEKTPKQTGMAKSGEDNPLFKLFFNCSCSSTSLKEEELKDPQLKLVESSLFTVAPGIRIPVPTTSSPSEWAFSAGGKIVTCKRSCLKPEKVEQLVFLAFNLRT